MAKQILTDLDFNNTGKITNLSNGTNPQDAVTKAQLDSAVEGLSWKDSARVATQSNINLSSPGTTIDGITLTNNDRVLVMAQTSVPTNGIYIFNGSSSAMTRALDADTAVKLEQAVLTVEEGTSAGTTYRQTSVNFTLESGDVTFTTFGTSAPSASESVAGIAEIATQAETDTGTDDLKIVTPLKLATWSNAPKRYTTTIGDGSNTSYTVTHNLNTRRVKVAITRVASPYDEVDVYWAATTVNTITVVFNSAPSSNQFNVEVIY